MSSEPTFNPAYRLARCGQQSPHGPHVVEHGPDQPRNCPGTGARRNPHCSNCGDTRGGPVGHEISECTWDSKTSADRYPPGGCVLRDKTTCKLPRATCCDEGRAQRWPAPAPEETR